MSGRGAGSVANVSPSNKKANARRKRRVTKRDTVCQSVHLPKQNTTFYKGNMIQMPSGLLSAASSNILNSPIGGNGMREEASRMSHSYVSPERMFG